MDQALNQKIDAFIAANKEQILEDHQQCGGHPDRGSSLW